MGCCCGEPTDADELFEEVTATAPYAALTRDQFDRSLNLVATGGYALKVYDRYKRIVQDQTTGKWRARDGRVAQQHRMNVGAIIEADMINVRLASRGSPDRIVPGAPKGAQRPLLPGRKLGQIEEWFIEGLTPGDTLHVRRRNSPLRWLARGRCAGVSRAG